MSTRSYICRENEDGSYTGVYCHSDGYLTYNGAMLLDHFKERDKVDRLLSLGSLSYLQPKIDPDPEQPHEFEPRKVDGALVYNRQDDVCMFYGRDRGEKDQQAFPVKLEDVGKDDWIEYCYVFMRDGTWKYFETNTFGDDVNQNNVLRDVETDLNDLFKGYGIDRPPNDYGWFSKEEIAKIKAEKEAQSGTAM